MKTAVRIGMCLALAFIVAMPLMADDEKKKKEKKKRDPAAAVLKRLAKADLTEEQVAKIKEVVAQHGPAAAEARKKVAGARAEAAKKAKADGLEGAEARKAIAAALKGNPDQKAAREAQVKLQGAINAVLTAEQKEKLGLNKKGKGKKPAGEKKPKSKKPGGAKKKPAEKKPEAKKDAN